MEDDKTPLEPQLQAKGVTGQRVVDDSAVPQLVAVSPIFTAVSPENANCATVDLPRDGEDVARGPSASHAPRNPGQRQASAPRGLTTL